MQSTLKLMILAQTAQKSTQSALRTCNFATRVLSSRDHIDKATKGSKHNKHSKHSKQWLNSTAPDRKA